MGVPFLTADEGALCGLAGEFRALPECQPVWHEASAEPDEHSLTQVELDRVDVDRVVPIVECRLDCLWDIT